MPRYYQDFLEAPSAKLAKRWAELGSARLDDIHGRGMRIRLVAATPTDKKTLLEVTDPYASKTPWQEIPHDERGRFYLAWIVTEAAGTHDAMPKVRNRLATIAGISTPKSQEFGDLTPKSTPELSSPRPDLLFRAGGLEISIIEGNERNRQGERFNLGAVIGLSIIDQNGTYPVWG